MERGCFPAFVFADPCRPVHRSDMLQERGRAEWLNRIRLLLRLARRQPKGKENLQLVEIELGDKGMAYVHEA